MAMPALITLLALPSACLLGPNLRGTCTELAAHTRAGEDFRAKRRGADTSGCRSPERAAEFASAYQHRWETLLSETCDPRQVQAWARQDALALVSRDAADALSLCGEAREELYASYVDTWHRTVGEACGELRIFALGAAHGRDGVPLDEGATRLSACPAAAQGKLVEHYAKGWQQARIEHQRQRVARAAELEAAQQARAADAAEQAAAAQREAAQQTRLAREASEQARLAAAQHPFPPQPALGFVSEPTLVDTADGQIEVYCRIDGGSAQIRAVSLSGKSFQISGRWQVLFRDPQGALLDSHVGYESDFVSGGEVGGFDVSAPKHAALCRAAPLP
jgi:hypothetical protein